MPAPLPVVLGAGGGRLRQQRRHRLYGQNDDLCRSLLAQVERVAAGLQQIGVNKGTKVGLFLPNTPTFIVYYYAILKAGGTVVNFNPLYTLEELTFQVKDSETEIMITHDLQALFPKLETLVCRGVLVPHRRCSLRRRTALAQAPALQTFEKERPGQHRRHRRSRTGLSTAPSLRATTAPLKPVDHRPARRHCGAAIHRRHHRHAQRRDADPRQPVRQYRADRGLGLRPGGRQGTRARGAAAVPRLCHDRRDEPRHRQGRQDHPDAPLPIAGSAEADPHAKSRP